MCHGLYLKYTRHDRFLRKMSLEERFVGCYIFHTDNVVRADGNDFVHQLERITVREQLANAVYVHDGGFIAVIGWGLYFVKFDFFAYLAGKLVINGVPRTGGNDTAFDGLAYQCQVTDDIQ
mgnify:CR=1 FL=1